jgi:CheY-like chemotaxis protein
MKKIKTVLLIDDDEPTTFINKKIIQSFGLIETIHTANSGLEALNFLSRTNNQVNETPIPDLILLDINMPAMDGWEFLTEYKKLKTTHPKTIVIVMLTTSLNPDDEMKAKDIKEVYGFKNKPLTKQMLEDIVINYF